MDCLAACTPGLEAVLIHELADLGARRGREVRGGVEFTAAPRLLYRTNAWLRTASRVLVRVARFRATTFSALEQQAAAVDWSPWLGGTVRPELRVTSRGSRLYHTGAIGERLAAVLPQCTDPQAPRQLVVVRVAGDTVTLSVDSSGEHLHRRGWRLATAKAPLRETLAAAMVLASGWDRTSPFVDPLCGSGTIVIEAALLAAGRAPGAQRSFAFQRWPSFEPGTWASVQEEVRLAETSAGSEPPLPIVAADRDGGAVRATIENAERAGVAGSITVRHSPIAATLAGLPEPAGWLVTNPPYGSRIGGRGDLRDLYATLRRAKGWHVGVLTNDPVLARHTGLPLHPALRTTNGGIPVTFWTSLPSGE